MNFMEIANTRQSCRSYDETRAVEPEKLEAVLEAARLSPSACNGQPYHITVCQGEVAKEVALLTRGMGGYEQVCCSGTCDARHFRDALRQVCRTGCQSQKQ